MKAANRLRFIENLRTESADEPNPSTPDSQVSPGRLEGRRAARVGRLADENPHAGAKEGRVDWYLGWYDVRLRKFYPA